MFGELPAFDNAATRSFWTSCPTPTATPWSIAIPPVITQSANLDRRSYADLLEPLAHEILPRLERGAHASQIAGAVRSGARQYLRRTVVRRGRDQLTMAPCCWPARASTMRPRFAEDLGFAINAVLGAPTPRFPQRGRSQPDGAFLRPRHRRGPDQRGQHLRLLLFPG